jgi:uncharacterized protein
MIEVNRIMTLNRAPALGPISASERISSLDVLRGCALLGILTMNIVGFALPFRAYWDPTIAGGASGVNLLSWFINEMFFDGKTRSLFAMLFGAGLILMSGRSQAEGNDSQLTDIYRRRNLWLIFFGAIHGYVLLWPGDILVWYGICAMLLFAFRETTVKRLILIGAVLLAIMVPTVFFGMKALEKKRAAAASASAVAAEGRELTDEQERAWTAWKEISTRIKPGPEEVRAEIESMQGGYGKVFKRLAPQTAMMESIMFCRKGFWDSGGMMFLGMALMKLGIFTAARRFRFYLWMTVVGYGIGLPLSALVAYDIVLHDFDPIRMLMADLSYQPLRLFVTLGHIGLIMMICKAGLLKWLTSRLAAVGRMALTNYFSQTIICTLLFYGYGFGLYGKLERHELVYVVLGIWVFQLIVSPIWLRHFRFGPFEWIWRSLTYQKRQPMRIRVPA